MTSPPAPASAPARLRRFPAYPVATVAWALLHAASVIDVVGAPAVEGGAAVANTIPLLHRNYAFAAAVAAARIQRGCGEDHCEEEPLRRLSSATATLPSPPEPYSYTEFKAWFLAQTWTGDDVKLRPQFSWFDVDGALQGKFQSRFREGDMSVEVAVAKSINRYEFMRTIIESGDDSSQSSLGMHLLILHLLRPELDRPWGVRALDIGCGTGWLLEAFALTSDHPASRIFGFDVEGVEEARRHLANTKAITSRATRTPPPEVFSANILEEGYGLAAQERARRLPPRSFDIVNVGLAAVSEDGVVMRRSLELVREGGVLTIPVCSSEVVAGRCHGSFRKYRSAARHHRPLLLDVVDNITFIVPVNAEGHHTQ